MSDTCARSEGDHQINTLLKNLVPSVSVLLDHSVEHLGGSLRKANIVEHLSVIILEHSFDLGLQVIQTHLVPVEVPVVPHLLVVVIIPGLVPCWIDMLQTESCASIVSKPDIPTIVEGLDCCWHLLVHVCGVPG